MKFFKIYKKHLFAVIILILYEIMRYNDSAILRWRMLIELAQAVP